MILLREMKKIVVHGDGKAPFKGHDKARTKGVVHGKVFT